jgi:hypothetical protein
MTRKFLLLDRSVPISFPSCSGKMQNGCTYQDFVDYGPEESSNGENGALGVS